MVLCHVKRVHGCGICNYCLQVLAAVIEVDDDLLQRETRTDVEFLNFLFAGEGVVLFY